MKTQLNNKGLSLVELLIAITIAAVVSLLIATMMTQSTSMFGRESRVIDVQNEMQVVQNQISEKLMEAKAITVVRCGDSIRIYTGEVEHSSNKLVAENGGSTGYTDCIITYTDGKLYVTSKYMETIPEGYLLSDAVLDFDIAIETELESEVIVNTLPNGTVENITKYYYESPLAIKVDMKIGDKYDDDNQKDADMIVKVRNNIKVYDEYTVTDFKGKLANYTASKSDIR